MSISQFHVSENIGELCLQPSSFEAEHPCGTTTIRDVQMFNAVHKIILSRLWSQFTKTLQERVLNPLQQLKELCNGPVRLIQVCFTSIF